MDDHAIDDLTALLPPLLASLDALSFVARQLHPPAFDEVMASIRRPDDALRVARGNLRDWPPRLAETRAAVEAAADAALAAFEGLRAVLDGGGDLLGVFKALRYLPRALEALYPLSSKLPPVSAFYLEPALRDDVELLAHVTVPARPGETGVMHFANEPGSRGGWSLYVPETYDAGRPWPLVMALHGGSGNGRAFLWSWLATARSRGAILIAPTAVGPTWALMGEDRDTPNLLRILAEVRGRQNIDPARLLLTGMSDGGTFAYVSGLEAGSPFTHLAPVAAAFHPLLAQMADPARVRGLPIFQVHGALDWMFPIETARSARRALASVGAAVTSREIADLSHCYPREINAEVLAWMAGKAGATAS